MKERCQGFKIYPRRPFYTVGSTILRDSDETLTLLQRKLF